jgi:hypothetical protein
VRLRDRVLTRGVARAITSPSAIVLAGAGAAAGILVGLGPIGAVALGAGAVVARVAAALPRDRRRPHIEPRRLDDPWRTLMREILDASRRFDAAVARVDEGPLRDRLADLGARLDTAVDESWRIASGGHDLARGRREIDTGRAAAELHAAEAGPRTASSGATAASIRAQLAAAERLDRAIADTHDRLRLLDARIDETVARTIELSLTQSDPAGLGGLGAEFSSIVDDMEALRQAVEETRRADEPTRGVPGSGRTSPGAP